ncbi:MULTISPECIES: chromate efflux transporter [Chryseobacterium]|uniref:Chromate transporter n=1 Tax=Chryseobacterium geocarposphaerae TaxID=1416776 RepID=A0ABU1LCH5_9FLAO|nr:MULTISPECIES: chromate efflux transporter [Chryseobacterium]MDR6404437.1 chromate transporter [Chryseobacterium geocarposphaerae]MDR6699852.1 chromate transporter [Chryseobacterium ginsenosidimutans]
MNRNSELKTLARVFITLGVTAFGGPAAHIAMMQQEVVAKRKWMSEEHFLDLMGATNLIPGPNSTEMAMHIGQDRAGWRGLVVAGSCFIFPAVVITLFFAWLYKEYGQLPEVQPFIYGIKPAIISIILIAILSLAKKSLKNIQLGVIGVVVLVLALMGVNEILLLFGAGILAMGLSLFSNRKTINSFLPLGILQVSDFNLFSTANVSLFLTFLKIGAILYGSGYVLFAFLDAELVENGLLTRQQLIDAIAVGQFTPGPVFSSVAFIGYQINGWSGAIVSTIGVFLPSFIFVALLNPIVKMMRDSSLFSKFLDAVNVASIAIIVSVCYVMAKESISDWRAILIGILCLLLSFSFKKLNSVWIVLLGSSLGYVLNLF